jgi:transposase InsO family protein
MISVPDRQRAVELIDEATAAGARRFQACAELRISERTARRWIVEGVVRVDQRPGALRPTPRNKLSDQERQAVLDVCHSEEFASLPPSQIVPRLADQGRYVASESSFYRVLRAEGQQHHRGRAKSPVPRKPPASYRATGPCQVWTWDITWLPGPIAGMFFYLYLIVDIFSRKIVGWEVYGRESAEYASIVVRRAVWSENCLTSPLVLHADNGSPMKGATLKVTLEHLGVTASYSRPRVSNDNPFSEALLDLQVPAGMAVQGLQRHRGRPRLGGTLRQLVQWRALAQRHPLRRAQHAACRTRSHRAGRARLPLDKGARGKAGTVVRTAAQLGASRSRLANPRARHRRPQNKRRRMNLTDNSFDKHRV